MVVYLRLGENIYVIGLNNMVFVVCDLCECTQCISLDVKGTVPCELLDLVSDASW